MVAQSLTSLLERASIDDHEEVLQSCNEALTKSKSDLNTQHVKTIALLKLDRYEDALRVLEAGGDALKKQAGLEYAYALYKSARWEEALAALAQANASRGVSHLEAQVVRPRTMFQFRQLVTDICPQYRATAPSNSGEPPISMRIFTKIRRALSMRRVI